MFSRLAGLPAHCDKQNAVFNLGPRQYIYIYMPKPCVNTHPSHNSTCLVRLSRTLESKHQLLQVHGDMLQKLGMYKWRIVPLWISSVDCKTFLKGLVSTSSSFPLASILCWSRFPSLSSSSSIRHLQKVGGAATPNTQKTWKSSVTCDPLKNPSERSWWDRHTKPEEGERAACLPCAST